MIELLIVVAIIGIISAIGISKIIDILSNTKNKSAHSSLLSIYLAEENYKSINKSYYIPAGSCGDQTDSINKVLFDGNITIENDYFRYCISGSSSSYKALANNKKTGGSNFTITNTKEKNWSD